MPIIHQPGDFRVIEKWIFKPTTIAGITKWFEMVQIRQKLIVNYDLSQAWYPNEWVEIPNKSPQEGDVRITERFVLWPLKLDNQWRWFKTVCIQEQWVHEYSGDPEFSLLAYWKPLHWSD